MAAHSKNRLQRMKMGVTLVQLNSCGCSDSDIKYV